MLNITDEQKTLLLEHITNAQEYIDEGNIDQLLEELDDRITEIGFDSNYELNSEGLELQKLYDEIYEQN